MRSGGCGLQQTLTAEAASVLKHSLALARRRGHAQLTPLHVAATLLALRSSSFRRACLKSHPHAASSHSHPHPLQCRALELCFNVALNRLPTNPTPTLLRAQHPSLSNALIAALKRAQAHHRRGCIEQQHQHQNQPVLAAIKVDLEQLIVSILDDPSVSRVMREAGFSSTAVKNNLDDASPSSVFHNYNASAGVFSSPSSPSPTPEIAYSFDPLLFSRSPVVYPDSAPFNYLKEDINFILDVLLRKKRKNTVIVGDSVCVTEGLMGRLERGEVPDELKPTRFIRYQFAPVSVSLMKREEIEVSLSELERKVDSVRGGGVIVYIGDLKWTAQEGNLIDYLVAEIGKLFCDYGRKVWLMGSASYQTYMRCQMRQPPLETQWALQAIPVPSSGPGLGLHASSVLDSKMSVSQNPCHLAEAKPLSSEKEEEEDKLSCCEECASNYEKEAQLFKPGQNKLLPSWLHSHSSTQVHHKDELTQLRRKWNRLCHCLHQSKHSQNQWNNNFYTNHSSSGKIYPYNPSSPWWTNRGNNNITQDSTSLSFADSIAKPSHNSNLVPRFRRQQSCTIEFNLSHKTQKHEPSLGSLKVTEGKEVKITLALGNSSSSFGDSGQTVDNKTDHTTLRQRAHVCKLLQENVPWQSETLLSSIAEAFLVDSKSEKRNSGCCWLFMQGNDCVGKRRLARAVAESVFGSASLFFNADMRKKETLEAPCSEMLTRALKSHERLVVLIENADFADAQFMKFLEGGFETGKFGDFSMEKTGQAIFILTSNGSKNSEEKKQDISVINLVLQVVNGTKPNLENKRKSEWDLLTQLKRPRTEGKEELSRQSSFNTLDLNIRAEEHDDDGEDKAGESRSIPIETNGFLDSIKNRFVFDRNPGWDKREVEAFFSSKIKRGFEEVFGKQCLGSFSVEERVTEEIRGGCGSFTNSLFEKWAKDIFESSLQSIHLGGKKEEGIIFKLCWGGKEERILDSGFMSSCLPKNVQVDYFMD